MSNKYKNISDQTQTIVGVGVVGPGQEFTTSQELINPNLQPLGNQAGATQPVEIPVEQVEEIAQ